MKLRILLIGVGLILSLSKGYGQAGLDTVRVRLQQISTCGADSVKQVYAAEIMALLQQLPFGSSTAVNPVPFLGYKRCSNGEMELFSWSVPLQGGLAYYNLFKFKDRNYVLTSMPEGEAVPSSYLFYDMLAFRSDKKEYYMLFGWSQSKKVNQKILLVAEFKEKGKIGFNRRLIRKKSKTAPALTFDYAKDASMMTKHDKNGKRIILDHLAPSDSRYEGYYMFYGPDSSYDALLLKKGEWVFQENVKIKTKALQ